MTFFTRAWLLCSLELQLRLCLSPERYLRPVFAAFHDGSCWCSTFPRRGFQSAKGLMRHITHHHTGSVVDKDTCALFMGARHLLDALVGLRRSGATVHSMWTGHSSTACGRGVTSSWGSSARPQPSLVWLAPRMAPLHPLPAHASNSDGCSYRRPSPRGSACCRPTPCSTFPPVAACACSRPLCWQGMARGSACFPAFITQYDFRQHCEIHGAQLHRV